MLSDDERSGLTALCAARDAALIVDEVFADYLFGRGPVEDGRRAAILLTFRLGGLSKSAALPQVKLGWISVNGPAALVDEALGARLICDTYLSCRPRCRWPPPI